MKTKSIKRKTSKEKNQRKKFVKINNKNQLTKQSTSFELNFNWRPGVIADYKAHI